MSEACAICGASTGSAADLIAHQRSVHKEMDAGSIPEMNPEARIPGFPCGLCGQRFSTAKMLADHNMRTHSVPGNRSRRPRPSAY